jgi:hypothetical protein
MKRIKTGEVITIHSEWERLEGNDIMFKRSLRGA